MSRTAIPSRHKQLRTGMMKLTGAKKIMANGQKKRTSPSKGRADAPKSSRKKGMPTQVGVRY